MLVNIFFALIALGAMCIDIVLNRGLLDEVNDEAEEQKKDLEEFLKREDIPDKIKKRIKNILDTVDTLTEKIKIKIRKGCASINARPFYIVIIISCVAVVISVLNNYSHNTCEFYKGHWFPNWLYLSFYLLLNGVWLCVFFYLLKKLYLIYVFNKNIENERNKIRKIIQDTKYSILTLFS